MEHIARTLILIPLVAGAILIAHLAAVALGDLFLIIAGIS